MSDRDAPLILYVDDERPNRVVFEQSLGDEFRVRTAPDARTALDLLAELEVAVLITDQRMPEMTGDELLRIAKQRWPNTIRMVITAYSDVEPILAAINEGLVARYVIKPWSRDELVQLLHWAIGAWTFGRESAELQRRLLETERLTTLGSIAGAVVHDLNQPLAGLALNAERLVELAGATPLVRRAAGGATLDDAERALVLELADELGDLAVDLRDGASHLREVTGGLSQFLRTRATTGGPVATDPMPIVRNALAVCNDLAVRARGAVAYDGPPTLPPVRMPATELTQVLINLVANACHALAGRSDPGGRVTLIARPGPTMLSILVRDDGIGMTPEVLAKVGTPFFTTRTEGIGLGLAQCQRLVGKTGGTLRIDSIAGEGTTVSINLPNAG